MYLDHISPLCRWRQPLTPPQVLAPPVSEMTARVSNARSPLGPTATLEQISYRNLEWRGSACRIRHARKMEDAWISTPYNSPAMLGSRIIKLATSENHEF